MSADLVYKLTGGAANSDPDASLGGVGSSVDISGTALNNLFDNVSPTEAQVGDVEYRAFDIYNEGDATAEAVIFWITDTTNPESLLEVGLDSGTQSIVNESTAPSSPTITFSSPTEGSPLVVSDISVGSRQRVWIKRTISAAADNIASDLGTLHVRYA